MNPLLHFCDHLHLKGMQSRGNALETGQGSSESEGDRARLRRTGTYHGSRVGYMERVHIRDQEHWWELAQQAHYRSPALASLLSVSPRQLHRYTRKNFGRSPQAWLDDQRLARATGLLRQWRSVKAVSYELGFKQVSHFSRVFKRRYGMPPGRYVVWSDGAGGNGGGEMAQVRPG